MVLPVIGADGTITMQFGLYRSRGFMIPQNGKADSDFTGGKWVSLGLPNYTVTRVFNDGDTVALRGFAPERVDGDGKKMGAKGEILCFVTVRRVRRDEDPVPGT